MVLRSTNPIASRFSAEARVATRLGEGSEHRRPLHRSLSSQRTDLF
jgi:hypothetical protein